ICLGDTTKFNGTPTDAIDQFQWAFGDGAGSTVSAPNHVYAAPGTYTVSMRLTNRCGLDTTIVKTVIINPRPPAPTNPAAISLCNGPVTLDAGPAAAYLWSNGTTNRTITGIVNPGVFTVTTTDANGCKARGTSIVADNRPRVNLGPDIEVCQNNSVANLDAQNLGSLYAWTLNSVPNGNSFNTQAVDTTLPAVLTYGVTVTDPITNCSVTDSKTITVKVSPSFSLTGVNPTCGNPDGSISITLNATVPSGGPYSYFISGPSFNQQGIDQSAPSTVGPLAGRLAGTYSGIVTDQISGCTISKAVPLSDAAFTINASASACDPTVITASLNTGTPPAGVLQFSFIPAGPCLGAQPCITTGPLTSATLPFSTPIPSLISAGTYSVEVRDALGCT
ncbi:MAG: PKD domain-containing protein, partial [Flammeovirgaceae bacterium]